MLVVIEEHEPLRHDAGVAREDEANVDLLALESCDRERTADIEWLEVLEREPVDILEAERAEGPRWALRRPAQDHVLRVRRQITDLLQGFRARGVFGDYETVLVGRVRGIEDSELIGVESLLQPCRRFLLISRRLGDLAVLVDEGEERCEVLGKNVDLPRFQGRVHDVARPQIELLRYLVAVRLEDLGIELAQR